MNVTDDLELRLRSWMVAAAPSGETAGIVDRAMTGTAGIRQRPAFLVDTGIRHGRSRIPTPSPTLRILLIAVLVIALAAASIMVGSQLRRPPDDGILDSTSGGSGTPVGRLAVNRTNASATLLADGRVLLAGGDSGNGSVSSVEIWDPATERSTTAGSMRKARVGQLAALLPDGRVLLLLGYDDTTSTEIFDPRTGTSVASASLRVPREWWPPTNDAIGWTQAMLTTLRDGRVLVAGGVRDKPQRKPTGGWTGPDLTQVPEVYDPRAVTFTTIPDVPCTVSGGSLATLRDGRVLFVCVDGAAIWDPSTNAYTAIVARGSDSAQSAVVLRDGRVLVTGRTLRSSRAAAELFDPTTGRSTLVASSTNPAGPGVLLDDGKVLFGNLNGFQLFDPARDAFDVISGPTPRAGGTMTLLGDGRVLLAGGAVGAGNVFQPTYLFDPR